MSLTHHQLTVCVWCSKHELIYIVIRCPVPANIFSCLLQWVNTIDTIQSSMFWLIRAVTFHVSAREGMGLDSGLQRIFPCKNCYVVRIRILSCEQPCKILSYILKSIWSIVLYKYSYQLFTFLYMNIHEIISSYIYEI